MTQTIMRAYDKYSDATAAVADLEKHGFSDEQISLVAPQGQTEAGEGAGIGGGVGGVVGAGVGLLAGLGLMAIPGLGPVIALGWLASAAAGAAVGAAAGAATGGLVGSMIKAGVSEEDANLHAEALRRGSSLVSVRISADRSSEALTILEAHHAIDPLARRALYQSEGWSRFDPDRPN